MLNLQLICEINDKEHKIEIKNENEENNGYLTYGNITDLFYKYLIKEENKDFLNENDLNDFEKEDLIFEYIRYFEQEGWVILNEEDLLILNNKETTKIFIKVRIKTTNEKTLLNNFNKIDLKVDELSNKIIDKNDNNNDKQIIYNDSEIDIVVLTANPLVKKEGENITELKTMNDFNNITNTIMNVIRESTKFITAKFYPLTKNNLKEAIRLRPKIIHLICKSTYFIPNDAENENSFKFVNLLFEDNDYFELELIDQKKLDSIFEYKEDKKSEKIEDNQNNNSIRDSIRNIFLIISTQLSNDVYRMVEKYEFKNILVQHTTVSDSSFVSDFNDNFYKNIIYQININDINNSLNVNSYQIDSQKLNDFFNVAINIYLNKEANQFCCCFHEHKIDCPFLQNFDKELYNQKKNNDKGKDISHFSHLMYKCDCNNKDFCEHTEACDNNIKKKKKESSCCCQNKKVKKKKKNEKNEEIKINHYINNDITDNLKDNKIFPNDFSKENKINNIQLGYGINNFGVIKNSYMISDYEKMKFIVGRNKYVYEVYKLLFYNSKAMNIINVYSENKKNYELNELCDITIEYIKERINFIYNDINLEEDDLKLESSKSQKISSNKKKEIHNFSKRIQSESNINSHKKMENESFHFEKITLKDIKQLNIKENISNKIYFIIIYKDDALIQNLINYYLDNLLIKNTKIVIFTEKKIDEKFFENSKQLKIERIGLNKLEKEDYNIQYQKIKITKNKRDFEEFINQKMVENQDVIPIEINIELNKKYEILFLFHCIKYYLQDDEMKVIYKNINNLEINEGEIRNEFEELNKKIKNEYLEYNKLIEIELNKYNNLLDKEKEVENYLEKLGEIAEKEHNNIIEIICSEYRIINKDILNKNKIYFYDDIGEIDIIKNQFELTKKNLIKKEDELIENKIKNTLGRNIKSFQFAKLQEHLKQLNFKTIKELIEKSFNIVILKTITVDKEIRYKKINFDLYYDNWKNNITDEIKQKILEKLFEFYSILFHSLINKNNESFKGIQNLGKILNLNLKEKGDCPLYFKNDKGKKYLYHLVENFCEIFNEENIDLCKKNLDIWFKIKKNLEDISITYYSCLKQYEMNEREFKNKIFLFEKLFEKDYNVYARIILMRWVYYQTMHNLDKLDYKLKELKEIKSEENLIDEFSESIIKIYNNKNDEQIEEDKECKDIDKNNFIQIFENRIKYSFYKYKINFGLFKEEDKLEIINVPKMFKKNNCHFWEIKSYILIANLYNKTNNNNGVGDINNKENYYGYLNFSFYLYNYYNKEIKDLKEYFDTFTIKKIKEENNLEYKIIKEKIKNYCNEFDYKYNEGNISEYLIDK